MNTRSYSHDIAQAIDQYLTENDWHFTFDEQRGIFRFKLNLRGKVKLITYYIDVKDNEYVVYAVSPLSADPDDPKVMANMAEFVCRANFGLMNGNFELDVRDGELRYKSYVNCDGVPPSDSVIRNSIHCPARMFDRYGNGIVDMLFGDVSPKDAIERCESNHSARLPSALEGMLSKEDLSALLQRLAAPASEDGKGEAASADDNGNGDDGDDDGDKA